MKNLVTITDATLRIGSQTILSNTNWNINKGEHWAIIGPNGSGKSTLVKALWGGTSLQKGTIEWKFIRKPTERLYEKLRKHIGYVSFELQQQIVKQERLQAEFRAYKGAVGDFTPAEELVGGSKMQRSKVAKLLEIENLMAKDISTLSTGESLKILLARALVKQPRILILDEPFDGLDSGSREQLRTILDSIIQETQVTVILVTHREDEINAGIKHVLQIQDRRIVQRTGKGILTPTTQKLLPVSNSAKLGVAQKAKSTSPTAIVRMENVTVKYDEKVVLHNFSWQVQAGEKWVVLGPNGSGKSTLLKLITGDHPQAYSNDIWLFGKKRGTGESIWEIKKRIGLISSDMQLQYLKNLTGLEVIVSGFFDSFGLYQRASKEQIEQAKMLADKVGICQLLTKSYLDCSNGQKRMFLLARALIKQPDLLILDEPLNGLDPENRIKILNMLNYLAKTNTTLIYVTHHKEEIGEGFTSVLRLQ